MDSGWWAVVVAVVAAGVAAWQAVEAARSRRQAKQASEDAAVHERTALAAARDSAGAAKRSAEATERLAAVAEAQAVPRLAWGARYVSGDVYEVVNQTGMIVTAQFDSMLSSRYVQISEGAPKVLVPEEAMTFRWPDRLSTPGYAEVAVFWYTAQDEDEGGRGTTTTVTLRRAEIV